MGKKKEGTITIVLDENDPADKGAIDIINKVAREINFSSYGKPIPLEVIAKKLIREADNKIQNQLVDIQRGTYTNVDKINLWTDGYNQKEKRCYEAEGKEYIKIKKDDFIVNVLPELNKKQLGVLESLAFKSAKASQADINILQ